MIPSAIKNVENKAIETNEMVRKISENNSFKKETQNINKEEVIDEETVSVSAILNSVIETGSWNGKRLLYICKLSFENKQSFSIAELFDEYEKNYIYGYLVSLSSIGIINYTYKDEIVSMLEISKHIRDKIYEELIENAKENDANFTEDELEYFGWMRKINKIDKYFK